MKITTLDVAGLEVALTKAQRNPMNSWDKSDSLICNEECGTCIHCPSDYEDECKYWNTHEEGDFIVGENDLGLAQRLIKGGAEHCKFLRQIRVWANVDMPRYWWSEYDTYKIATNANSCSTMHRLLNNQNPITLDLFVSCEEDLDIMQLVIDRLEQMRQEYLITKDVRLLVRAKRLLPEGFLQLRTVDLSYANLRNMYFQRRHHRLKEEWIDVFCTWVESLPYAKELIMYEGK